MSLVKVSSLVGLLVVTLFVVVSLWFPDASFTYTLTEYVVPAVSSVNLYVFPVPFTGALLFNWYQYSVTPLSSVAVTVTFISVFVTVVVTLLIVGFVVSNILSKYK